MSEPWVRRLKQRRRADGSIGPRPSGSRRYGHFDPIRLEQLERWLRKDPDATLEDLLGRGNREMGLRCSLMAVCRAIGEALCTVDANECLHYLKSCGYDTLEC